MILLMLPSVLFGKGECSLKLDRHLLPIWIPCLLSTVYFTYSISVWEIMRGACKAPFSTTGHKYPPIRWRYPIEFPNKFTLGNGLAYVSCLDPDIERKTLKW